MPTDTLAPNLTLDDFYTAHERIRGVALRTPLIYADALSRRHDLHILLKLENLQTTGAFKLRGAYNKIAGLSAGQRANGLVAASSGNHAQGVAYAASVFGLDQRTTIFMPESTPQTKIERTQRFGGVQVQLVEGTFDDARAQAHDLAASSGATFIEPYNDLDIIAGQGTIGLEIMQAAPDTAAIITPVGGGGLISGIALAAQGLKPDVQVYGVGANYRYSSGATVADGIRVKRPGTLTQPIIDAHVRQLVRVDEANIEKAVSDLMQAAHVVAEGAGAVALAALNTGLLRFAPGTRVVLVLSGGNIDAERMRQVLLHQVA
jgi:threonine dehydratase